MAKPKMKGTVIPKFSSEGEEAAWWDSHRSEVEAQIRKRIKQKRPLALGNLMKDVSPARRKKIERRAARLVREEMALRILRRTT